MAARAAATLQVTSIKVYGDIITQEHYGATMIFNLTRYRLLNQSYANGPNPSFRKVNSKLRHISRKSLKTNTCVRLQVSWRRNRMDVSSRVLTLGAATD